ncbi:MAG: Hsp20/alpha crystallin family protein [Lachnospiraceae bacterium]|nr:Hsp20/alpha crystallin family protein [Lachnospiraceae bacterium]MBR5739360.1 Hsp20/alpha crystallin family protein [Lachnospiraceae bacterium]
MLFPSIFTKDFVDPFDEWERRFTGKRSNDLMKTDVKETDKDFLVDIDLPGFSKADIQISLEEGYLTVSAAKEEKKEDKDEKNGRYLRRERYMGACSRSFYVGEDLTEEDIQANFEKGVLSLTIPKKEEKPKVPEKKYIAIGGSDGE